MRAFEGQPQLPPHICAITRNNQSDLWFDTGNNIPIAEPRIYVSREGCIEAAKAIEWVDPAEHEVALGTIADLVGQLEEAKQELETKQKLIDAYELIDKSAGLTPAAA
jgi:hypothetical protein